MKKYLFGVVFAFALFASPVYTRAAGLLPFQVDAILAVLSSFGVDQSVVNNVKAILTNTANTTSTPSIEPAITSINVSPATVTSGEAATLTFSSANTNYCHIWLDSNTLEEGYTAAKGYAQKNLNIPNTLSAGEHSALVYCWDTAGKADSKTVKFTVTAAPVTAAATPTATPTATLNAPSSVVSGQKATVTWSSEGTSSCSLVTGSNDDYAAGAAPLTGSKIVGPITYTRPVTLTCAGAKFGTSVTKTATIGVTAAPVTAATVNLTVPNSVVSGQKATVSWSTTNATYCSLTTGSASDYAANATPLNGTKETDPVTAAKSVKLSCYGLDGTVVTKSSTIGVTAAATPTATLNAPSSVVSGQKATVTWSSEGTSSCSLVTGSNDDYAAGAAPLTGSKIVGPITYTRPVTLTCAGAKFGTSVTKTATIGVTAAPVTAAITASLTKVPQGQVSEISWSVENASSCSLPGVFASQKTVGGSYVAAAPAVGASVTYAITCTGTDGATVTKSVTITGLAATVSLGSSVNMTASALNAFQSAGSQAPAVTPAQSSFAYAWNVDLQIGSQGADVTALQTALAKEGVYTGEITGGFYDQTYLAVKAFQQKYGINATGYVGAITRTKLNELY